MNKKFIPPLLIAIFIAVTIFLINTFTLTSHINHPVAVLREGWTVKVNGTRYDDVNVTYFFDELEHTVEAGDYIVMSITLPDLGVIPSPAIVFLSRYTTLDCYLDGEQIYSFGHEMYENKKFLGRMYHFITIRSDYAGKTLTFSMRSGERKPYVAFNPPKLGAYQDLSSSLVHENLIIIATGVFLFMFGTAFLSIALLFVTSVKEVKSLLFGAIFSMNIGAWLLSYYNVLSFFVYTPYETQIEYFTMYLIVPYCYLLIYYILNLKGNRIYLSIMAVSCGIPLMQYFLHYCFNIHLRVTLPLYHIDGFVGIAVIIYFSLKNVWKKNIGAYAQTQTLALLVFSLTLGLHMIVYYLDTLHIPTPRTLNKILITLGCLLFAMCQLATYLIYITENYARKQENVSLSHLAYADGLTNLANRAKTDKYMEELDKATDDYCIISIDLNGLKAINDKYGHPTGDRYIKDFSKVLSTTFGEVGLCARVGGDEFIVIMRNAGSEDISAYIDRMNSALNVMNALYTEYQRSVATGFAFSHEFRNPTAHKVYMRADKRMYEEKRKMHEEMGVTVRL